MISDAYLAVRSEGYQSSRTNISYRKTKTPQAEENNGSSIQKKSSEENAVASAANAATQILDDLGDKRIPASSEHGNDSSTTPETVRSTSDNTQSSDSVSNFFFKNNSVKFAWAGAYMGSNVLRIGESVLDEVSKTDSELAAVVALVNIVRMAIVVILQIYDTASAEHSGNELAKKEADSIGLLEILPTGSEDAINLAKKIQAGSASAPSSADKEDAVASHGNEDNARLDPGSCDKESVVENYCVSFKAKKNIEKYSASVGEAKKISGLVSAKETFFTAGAVIGLVKGVVALVKITVPTMIVGTTTAPGIVVAGLVLAVAGAVAGMAANLIDIYQGFAKRKEAREEIEDFSNRKKDFEEKITTDNPLGGVSPMFRSGVSSFLDKKIASANIDEGYAVGRIIRGFVGLGISVANTVFLIVSGGSASPIAGIVGGVTLAIYFAFIIAKINWEALKVEAEIEECNAAENLKKKHANIEIFDKTADSKHVTDDDHSENPYGNRYFLAWIVAKQFKKDVLKDNASQKVQQMDDLLETIGLTRDEIKVLKLLPAGAPKTMELIEGMIRSKLKITDRKPQQKEPVQAPQSKAERTGGHIPAGAQIA